MFGRGKKQGKRPVQGRSPPVPEAVGPGMKPQHLLALWIRASPVPMLRQRVQQAAERQVRTLGARKEQGRLPRGMGCGHVDRIEIGRTWRTCAV